MGLQKELDIPEQLCMQAKIQKCEENIYCQAKTHYCIMSRFPGMRSGEKKLGQLKDSEPTFLISRKQNP